MNRYLLTPAAQADLRDIYAQLEKSWDTDRVETCVRRIQSAIVTAAARPAAGRPIDEIRPGYRTLSAAYSHVVYYRPDDNGDVVITRILHQRPDTGAHL